MNAGDFLGSSNSDDLRSYGIIPMLADPVALGSGATFSVLEDLLFGGGESGRDTSGDVAFMTGQLLKNQFEDWKKTFVPIELQALNQISLNNPSVLPKALSDAEKTVKGTFGTMRGVLDRQNQSLGIQPTEEQKRTQKRLLNLQEASTTAEALNDTRSNVRMMDEALLMGTAPNPNIAKSKPGVTG